METERPYRDFVEAEARHYWQEITNPGGLVKPTERDLFASEPRMLRNSAEDIAIERNNYAEAEVAAMQPRPEADNSEAMQTERPYQAFVESEARQYWLETSQAGALVKPTQEQIRAAALPILCLALRNRAGNRRHQAVADMVQHARDRGWIRPPYSRAHASPSYIDALIQLADDANWVAREIPLPDYPPPRHPRIYYTIQFVHGRPVPVPRDDAIIRGNYMHHRGHDRRITEEDYVYPVKFLPDGIRRHGRTEAVTSIDDLDPTDMHGFMLEYICPIYYGLTFDRLRKPLYFREVHVWFDWKLRCSSPRRSILSVRLRDFRHRQDLQPMVFFSPHPPSHFVKMDK